MSVINTNLAYTNINTAQDVLVVWVWLDSVVQSEESPLDAVTEAMASVIQKNTIHWEDIYFLNFLEMLRETSYTCT